MALSQSGGDAVRAFGGGWTHDGFDLAISISMIDLNPTRAVEIDKDGGDGGVVVDGNLLMRAVMSPDNLDSRVFEDGPVVLRECDERILSTGGDGCGGKEQNNANSTGMEESALHSMDFTAGFADQRTICSAPFETVFA